MTKGSVSEQMEHSDDDIRCPAVTAAARVNWFVFTELLNNDGIEIGGFGSSPHYDGLLDRNLHGWIEYCKEMIMVLGNVTALSETWRLVVGSNGCRGRSCGIGFAFES